MRAQPHERTPERNGQANGFKERTLSTQIGLSVPQVRGGSGGFCPASLDAALLSEKALKVALAEMYVQGVATRRVKEILESLCGFEVSSSEVSRASKAMDGVLERWRERPLGQTQFVQLDAGYPPEGKGAVQGAPGRAGSGWGRSDSYRRPAGRQAQCLGRVGGHRRA